MPESTCRRPDKNDRRDTSRIPLTPSRPVCNCEQLRRGNRNTVTARIRINSSRCVHSIEFEKKEDWDPNMNITAFGNAVELPDLHLTRFRKELCPLASVLL